MLTVGVLERSAELRAKLIDEISTLLGSSPAALPLLPRVNLIPIPREELRFVTAPDVCVLGPELLERDGASISEIRRTVPYATIVARVRGASSDLVAVERLARLGVDEVIFDDTAAEEFLRRILLIARKRPTGSGLLILVDSAKGGVGRTTVAAALAESLAARGKRTVVMDLDFETQDLSRFLQAKPFINENLQAVFDHTRPLMLEAIEQSLIKISDSLPLWCMPPLPESEALYDPQLQYPRTLLGVLEILDGAYDAVVVDTGAVGGALLRTLYRVADQVMLVVTGDPAALFSAAERLQQMKGYLSASSRAVLCENLHGRDGLRSGVLRAELSRACGLDSGECWLPLAVPYARYGARWPGSGLSILHFGGRALTRAFEAAAAFVLGESVSADQRKLSAILSPLRTRLLSREWRCSPSQPPPPAALPEPPAALPAVPAQLTPSASALISRVTVS